MQMMGGYPVRPDQPWWEEPPLLRVTGEGRAQAAPDTAHVSLGFSSRAEQAGAAYQQTALALNQVVRALVEATIPQEQMQTEQVALQPIYEDGLLKGYEATASLRVTLRDLARVGMIIDLAVAAGANRVLGVQFELRERSAAESIALALAVQDAQRQAGVLARSLGVRVGPVWRAESEPAGPVVPFLARAAAPEALPVLPGTLTLIRRVMVEYLIQHLPS